MVCPLWYVWDALRCLIKFNKYIQCCTILLKLKPVYTKSYPHKYTYKDTHKDTHKYAAYRYTFIQLTAIHTNTRSNLRHKYAHKKRPQIHLQLNYSVHVTMLHGNMDIVVQL